jgi:hypothetical protein
MNYNNPINHRFSGPTKKDEQWYREKVKNIIPSTYFSIDDFESMKLSYDIINDDLTSLKKEFTKWCDPLEMNIKSFDPTPYPILHNKVNVLKGEMLKRQDEYSIVSLSNNVSVQKTKELTDLLNSKVEQQVERLIEAVKEGKSEEELQEIIQTERDRITPEDIDLKNFKSEWERFYEFALRICAQTQQIKRKKVESLEDLYATARFFIYSGWRHGKPYMEIRNSLFTGYHKSGNKAYVNKGEYIYYRQAKTVGDIMQEYKQYLDKDVREQLESNYGTTMNKSHSVIGRKTGSGQPKYNFQKSSLEPLIGNTGGRQSDKTLATNKTSSGNDARNYSSLIWETHIEFREFEKIYFLSYEDELGNKVTIPVTKKFDIPKGVKSYKKENRFGVKTKAYTWVENQVQYDIEEVEIPVKYEVIILSDDIYVLYRKVPNQVVDVDDPFTSFNLSTFGTIVSSRNSRVISPIQRVLPFYMQYIYVKYKQNKEIAKYEGYIQNIDVDQIPTDLANDPDGNQINDPIKVWLTFQSETGKNFYSGSQTKNNLPVPNTRAPGATAQILGAAQEIFTLQQLLELIDTEIGMSLGVPPQREANFETNSNASDNRQALLQSYHITEPYFAEIDEVYRQATEDYIQNFRQWCKIQLEDNNQSLFSYVLPDGTQELFEITPTMLDMESLGLYLKSNTNRREYNEYMLANIQAFAQNAGEGVEAISEILSGITSGQPLEETHRQVQIRNKQIQRNQQRQAQEDQQNQMQLLQRQEEMAATAHDRNKELITLKATIEGEYDVREAEIKAATAIATSSDAPSDI